MYNFAKIILCVCLVPALAFSEPQKTDRFFEHDYTKKIMEGGNEMPNASPGANQSPSESTARDSNTAVVDSSFDSIDNSAVSPTPSAEPTLDPKDKLHAIPIVRLGVILSGIDDKHFANTLQELLDVALKYNLALGKVVMVGPFNNPPKVDVFMGIAVLGGTEVAIDELPAKYSVSKSPTWIVTTAKGEILLEGFTDLERFMNSKGEFVQNTF